MERLKERYAAAKTAVSRWLRAVGGWCGRHRIASIAIGGVGFLLLWSWLVGGWWLATEGPRQALAAYAELPAKEKVEAFSKLATALGLLVAAPFALLGVGLAFWRTWNQHRDSELATRKLDAEAFAKAVEQLGHAEIAIRMGAVLALQNLAEASPRRLLGQTLEILCAYVREKRRRTKEADEQPAVPLPTDVKLTLQVISRLNRLNTDGKISVNLSNTDLRGADLREANLASVNFSQSNLRGATFSFANLQDADLYGANLQGADLNKACLQDASLQKANLQDVRFSNANLQNADLMGACLQNASLIHANLQDVCFVSANLQNAALWRANLKGTNVRSANLHGILLSEECLQELLRKAERHSLVNMIRKFLAVNIK